MSALKRDIFMGVPATRPQPEISYEEQRTQDYIKAYQKTGKPPQPVPQHPADADQRLALGLPPLFEPYVDQDTTTGVVRKDLAGLPATQVFSPTKMDEGVGLGEVEFHSIVMQKEYCHFSFEELRYQAYRAGKRQAPEAVTPATSGSVAPTLKPLTSLTTTTSNSLLMVHDSSEKLQSICCNPPFAMHSFEELRIAYLLLGREATSQEIRQQNNVIRLTV